MTKTVPFSALDRLLRELGFVRTTAAENRIAYRDDRSGAILLYREYDPQDEVWPPNIVATRETLADFGIMTGDDFDRHLEETAGQNKNGGVAQRNAKRRRR